MTIHKENGKLAIYKKTEEKLRNAQYGVWNHSTVDVCHWTKKALKGEGICYKRKFFGIETHRCMEFSPAGMYCHHRCIYCWRPTEFYNKVEMKSDEVDESEDIINHLLEERRKLLSGFGGNEKVDKEILKEAFKPSHFAISLSGEPTLYPKLPELIKYLKSLPETKSIFLVTNGEEPEMLWRLEREDALPTQVYLSLNAGTKKTFEKISCPVVRDGWNKIMESLNFIKETNTRTVIRITLIRGMNTHEEEIKAIAELIKRANPHFVEAKSYMHVGYSTVRLKEDHMLDHKEVVEWMNKLLKYLPDFELMDEHKESRIIIIQNKKRYVDRWIAPLEDSTYYKKYRM